MLLKNFDFATTYFNYKLKTEFEDTSNLKINGWYKFINGTLTALMAIENNLYFIYGENKIQIKEPYKVLLKRSHSTESEFSLVDGSDVQVKFSYHVPDLKFNVSPFEYLDEDDFIWGEFIAKIINDKERQRNFVANLMEC